MASLAHRELWRLGPESDARWYMGMTPEEVAQQGWKRQTRKRQSNSDAQHGISKISEASRLQLIKMARVFVGREQATLKQLCDAAGITTKSGAWLLVAAESAGLLLWEDGGIIGSVNAAEWLEEQGVKEYAGYDDV